MSRTLATGGSWHGVEVQADRELGLLNLSPGDLRFILASLASIRFWVCPGHLLQDGDEEADLHLSKRL